VISWFQKFAHKWVNLYRYAEMLSHINPRACMYILSDHGFDCEAPGVERERWFNVPFKREPINPAALAAWEAAEPDAALQYPPRNRYIAETFDIKVGGCTSCIQLMTHISESAVNLEKIFTVIA
jgi:hypothetical protein